jgi:hypothetical protein
MSPTARVEDGMLEVDVPEVNPYAVLVAEEVER